MNLTGKIAVVVGGGGLIGSHSVGQLTRTDAGEIIVDGNVVRALEANFAGALAVPRVEIYDVGGDILQTDVLNSALDGEDGVFPFAALGLETADRFYNAGTGTRASLKGLAERIFNLTGCNQPIQYAPRNPATQVLKRTGSPKRASEEIGFTAEIPLDEGLRRLIEWRKADKARPDAGRLDHQ